MRGVWTALITPFNDKNELDLSAFRKILRDQRDAGVTGVIPCGTTGESPTLTVAEKKLLIQTAIEELRGSAVQVVAGTGSNNTAETIELSRWASDAGAQGVLIVTPYYNKPSQAGLEAHFLAVAEAVRCEVMLYNVPSRTGVSLSASTVAALASHPRITSLKEATANVAFASEIIDTLNLNKTSLDILSGDDATFLPLLSVGAVGVVSVASNLFPRVMVAIHQAATENRLGEARSLHQKYYPLFRDLFMESNPVPIKHAMALMGFCDARVRSPLVFLSNESAEKLRQSLEHRGLARGKPA